GRGEFKVQTGNRQYECSSEQRVDTAFDRHDQLELSLERNLAHARRSRVVAVSFQVPEEPRQPAVEVKRHGQLGDCLIAPHALQAGECLWHVEFDLRGRDALALKAGGQIWRLVLGGYEVRHRSKSEAIEIDPHIGDTAAVVRLQRQLNGGAFLGIEII